MAKKIVITASLTGVLATRAQCPYIPYTPKEIALEGKRAVDAGASVLHIHARQDSGAPAYDIETYRQIGEEVRLLCPDVLINYSTGAIGLSKEERIQHVLALKPDMAALNMGSMNYGIYSPKTKSFYHDFVFQNPFSEIQFYLEKMKEVGTIPEMEVFDNGQFVLRKENSNDFRQTLKFGPGTGSVCFSRTDSKPKSISFDYYPEADPFREIIDKKDISVAMSSLHKSISALREVGRNQKFHIERN